LDWEERLKRMVNPFILKGRQQLWLPITR